MRNALCSRGTSDRGACAAVSRSPVHGVSVRRPVATRFTGSTRPRTTQRSPLAPVAMAAAGDAAVPRGGSVLRQVLTGSQRTKLDTGDDREFYGLPRFVKHVDEGFLAQVTELYRQRIPPGAAVLDLCSSWVSHLPPEVKYSKVVGHGLNAAELGRNPRLESFFVRNLNKEPDGWAAADQSYDAVLCCVSVQYMQQPERVFAEIYRVLKPGGVVIITFSNRLFYNKAIAAWRDASGYARCQLVRSYFQAVAGFTEPEVLTKVELQPGSSSSSSSGGAQGGVGALGAALAKALGPLGTLFERSSSDAFYAVVAYRNFKRE